MKPKLLFKTYVYALIVFFVLILSIFRLENSKTFEPLPVTNDEDFPLKTSAAANFSITSCLEEFAISSEHLHDKLVQCIIHLNRNSKVLNSHVSHPEYSLIIAILAHKRQQYLGALLKSLEKSDHIKDVLLLISHDGYYPEVHNMVNSIRFCRVKQIYHPFSKDLSRIALQMFNSTNSEVKLKTSVKEIRENSDFLTLKINSGENAQDSFIADKHLTQGSIKHHYWWLWNFIYRFNARLPDNKFNSNSNVLFLEEDHYVSTDFIDVLSRLKLARETKCSECFGLNLGYHLNRFTIPSLDLRNEIQYSALGNLGMVLSWSDFVDLSQVHEEFCRFNDYNWDWTLAHLAQKGLISDISLVPSIPRAFHIGLCGTHIKHSECDPINEIQQIEDHIIVPLKKFSESSFRDTGFVDINPVWRERKYSSQTEIKGYEGWTFGRLRLNSDIDTPFYMWKSDININHCLLLAKTDSFF